MAAIGHPSDQDAVRDLPRSNYACEYRPERVGPRVVCLGTDGSGYISFASPMVAAGLEPGPEDPSALTNCAAGSLDTVGIGLLVLAYKVQEPKIMHPIGDNLDISPPIFIQVGFANTGRTSLQRNFFSTRDDIFYVGEPYGECGGIFTMIKNIEDFTRSRAPASLPGSARANHCRRMASSSLQAFNRLFYSRPYLVASGYRRGAALCE
jgi:hypothetical protein